ncbi:TLC domain-containing protein 2-like [Babylonia areolata]|uniref:TLC domain-containing protein 2-like n=1 Tax=Babylonia areolata TaxID=304850 RepID=UPI003FD0F8F6
MESAAVGSGMWPESIPEAPVGVCIIFFSAFLFYMASILATKVCPRTAAHSSWRWKNITISFLHACISGPWALSCFWETPKMVEDMISTYSSFSYVLISMAVGYFVYDMIDMVVCQRTRQSLELVGHHIVIITCYMVSVTTQLYVGYAVVGLLVEVNSIFLHIRQLMQICGVSRKSVPYRVNSLINLATFMVFRISLLAWMTRWIVINRDKVPLLFYSLGSMGLAVLTLMNIVLFYRILRSDFFSKKGGNKDSVLKTD